VSELPDKQYFKIGEVARITGVKPHVLRYWETEFSAIRPQKSSTNQRLYRRQTGPAQVVARTKTTAAKISNENSRGDNHFSLCDLNTPLGGA